MTPEAKVKAAIKELLNKYDTYYHMPVPTGHGKMNGLDFLGCHWGMFFAIEAKAPGEKPTPRQKITIDDILATGGHVWVIDSTNAEDEQMHDLECWLINPTLSL